jgi:hypothetical protein
MSMNRIQFQPGLSLPEFLKHFGTETQCATALEQGKAFVVPAARETFAVECADLPTHCSSARAVAIRLR